MPYTMNGRQARKPFGRGWMTVESWNQIKDDPTKWGEIEARQRLLAEP